MLRYSYMACLMSVYSIMRKERLITKIYKVIAIHIFPDGIELLSSYVHIVWLYRYVKR